MCFKCTYIVFLWVVQRARGARRYPVAGDELSECFFVSARALDERQRGSEEQRGC